MFLGVFKVFLGIVEGLLVVFGRKFGVFWWIFGVFGGRSFERTPIVGPQHDVAGSSSSSKSSSGTVVQWY